MYLSQDTIQWTNIRYKSNDVDINATIWRLVFRNAHYILHFYELEWVKLTNRCKQINESPLLWPGIIWYQCQCSGLSFIYLFIYLSICLFIYIHTPTRDTNWNLRTSLALHLGTPFYTVIRLYHFTPKGSNQYLYCLPTDNSCPCLNQTSAQRNSD